MVILDHQGTRMLSQEMKVFVSMVKRLNHLMVPF
jgi:hypothetical protein